MGITSRLHWRNVETPILARLTLPLEESGECVSGKIDGWSVSRIIRETIIGVGGLPLNYVIASILLINLISHGCGKLFSFIYIHVAIRFVQHSYIWLK